MKVSEFIEMLKEKVEDLSGRKGVVEVRRIHNLVESTHRRHMANVFRPMGHDRLESYFKPNLSDERRIEKWHHARAKKAWKRTYTILQSGTPKKALDIINRINNCKNIRLYRLIEVDPLFNRFMELYSEGLKTDTVKTPAGKNPMVMHYQEDGHWEEYSRKNRYYRVDNRYVEIMDKTGRIVKKYHLEKGEKIESVYDQLVPGRKERRKAVSDKRRAQARAEEKKQTKVYKLVALVDGAFESIFSGQPYEIGETSSDKIQISSDEFCEAGGIFVYSSAEEAEKAVYPEDSANATAKKAVISGRAWGKRHTNGNKWAFENFKPEKLIKTI